jgi:hypothetical protein
MAISTASYLNQRTMPPQKLSESEKTEEWGKNCIDAIIGMSELSTYNGRSSKYRKQVNYNLVNSIFDEKDFDYVLNPFNLPNSLGGTPTRLQDFNIIRAKIELLKGEEIKRPFNYRVVAIGGEAVSVMEELKKKLILESLTQHIQLQLSKNGLAEPPVDENGNPVQPKTPEQIEKWLIASYTDIRERMANQILQYGERKDNFAAKFNKGWEHALVCAEEIYYIGIISGEPVLRVVNPLNFDYDKNPDLECIEDAQWAKEDRYMSVGQILDEFGEFLTDEDVEKLDRGMLGANWGSFGPMMPPGYAYRPEDFKGRNEVDIDASHIQVSTCVWVSMRKVGFVTDPEGNETMVDDTFKLTKELKAQGYTVEWQWIKDIWKGTKIGDSIYVDVAPLPNQVRSMDNPNSCKLPYVGRVYNNINSRATSIVDLAKPHQYTYIIVWYRLLDELAKAKGKKMVFDVAAIPRSMGIDMDKWMYYFDNLGIAFINSFEEGTEGTSAGQRAVSQFNQYTAIDMSLSKVISEYMLIIDKLEDMVGELCGVSRQRQGQISTNETVGGVERSVVQSSMVTESLFFYHNEVKKQVLTQYIETAKIAYMDGKKAQFMLDEIHRVFMDIDGDLFNDSDYGVFVSNSSKDNMIIDKLNQLAQVALQTDKAKLSDLITIFKSNSISEIEGTLRRSEQEALNRQDQQIQSQNEAMLQQQQMANEDAERTREFEAEQRQLDRDSKEYIAQIGAMGFNEDKDIDDNGVIDVLEIEKLRQKEIGEVRKASIEKDKLKAQANENEKAREHEKEMFNKEMKFKEQELKKKEQIERFKVKNKPKPKPPAKKK